MRKLWDFLLDIGNVTINSEESRYSTFGLIPEVVKPRDNGYPHDGRADKDSYRHDGREYSLSQGYSYPSRWPRTKLVWLNTGQ